MNIVIVILFHLMPHKVSINQSIQNGYLNNIQGALLFMVILIKNAHRV